MGDANTDALRRIKATGDDLTRPRDVDFTVVFPNESAAKQFSEHFRCLGHRTSLAFSKTVEECPWDVVVVNHMALSKDDIEEFENKLQDVASTFGGRNDGWLCLSEPSGNRFSSRFHLACSIISLVTCLLFTVITSLVVFVWHSASPKLSMLVPIAFLGGGAVMEFKFYREEVTARGR